MCGLGVVIRGAMWGCVEGRVGRQNHQTACGGWRVVLLLIYGRAGWGAMCKGRVMPQNFFRPSWFV